MKGWVTGNRGSELRRIEQRKALVLAEMYDPIIANLHRCIDGKRGKELLAGQQRARRVARGDDEAEPTSAVAPTAATEPVSRTRQRLGMPK